MSSYRRFSYFASYQHQSPVLAITLWCQHTLALRHFAHWSIARRGIGLGLVKKFLARDNTVIATSRKSSEATYLRQLHQQYPERLILTDLDTRAASSVSTWAEAIKLKDIMHVDVSTEGARREREGVEISTRGGGESKEQEGSGGSTQRRCLLPSLLKTLNASAAEQLSVQNC